MKPFDLEKAMNGHPVCTRDGRNVRIVCFDRKSPVFPIVALVNEDDGTEQIVESYTSDGRWIDNDYFHRLDLFLKD